MWRLASAILVVFQGLSGRETFVQERRGACFYSVVAKFIHLTYFLNHKKHLLVYCLCHLC
jgi:hypothetical protein